MRLRDFFSDKPEESYNYGKIINEKQFDRIASYLSKGKLFMEEEPINNNYLLNQHCLTMLALMMR